MKNLISIFLITILLLGFLACTDNNSEFKSADETDSDIQTEDPLSDNLPVVNYDGTQFVIWGQLYIYKYLYESDLTGEVVNDAVYNRNIAIEERFNIDLVWYQDTGWGDISTLTKSITAGDGAYDLSAGVCLYTAPGVSPGYYTDLNTLNYLDFNKPWWMKQINDEIEIKGRQYMVSGYFDMASVPRVTAVFFSTQLFDDLNLGSPFDLVDNGNWIYDKMIGYAVTAGSDLDGNGKYDEKDRYGITSQWDVFGNYIITTGYRFTTKDEDGNVSLTGYNDFLIQMNEKLYDLLYNQDYYYSGYSYQKSHNYENMSSVFTDNRALFMINSISYVETEKFREMGTYGILPIPKYTETQESYCSQISPFTSSIPIDSRDQDMSAILSEALQSVSYKQVLPAYYDIALSNKYANDENSVRMLDIIYGNTVCDFSYIYAQSGWDTALAYSVGIIQDYASWYAGKEANYNIQISKFVDKVAALTEVN